MSYSVYHLQVRIVYNISVITYQKIKATFKNFNRLGEVDYARNLHLFVPSHIKGRHET